ncbi:MAG: hypothetical protein ACK57C_10925, partial [Bacteroidota bacterium]
IVPDSLLIEKVCPLDRPFFVSDKLLSKIKAYYVSTETVSTVVCAEQIYEVAEFVWVFTFDVFFSLRSYPVPQEEEKQLQLLTKIFHQRQTASAIQSRQTASRQTASWQIPIVDIFS